MTFGSLSTFQGWSKSRIMMRIISSMIKNTVLSALIFEKRRTNSRHKLTKWVLLNFNLRSIFLSRLISAHIHRKTCSILTTRIYPFVEIIIGGYHHALIIQILVPTRQTGRSQHILHKWTLSWIKLLLIKVITVANIP